MFVRHSWHPKPSKVGVMRPFRISHRLLPCVRDFMRADKGNVAVIFGIMLLPIVGAVGAAVDYSRASIARTALQAALDSTALAVSKDAALLTESQLNAKVQSYFSAVLQNQHAKNVQVTASYSANAKRVLTLTATGLVDTKFMGLFGIDTIELGTSTKTKWGNNRLRLALALDNTGSMASSNKLNVLKTATKNLLAQLKAATTDPEDIYVSIVPFVKDVNVGPSNLAQSWIDWSEWDESQGSCTGYGGGSTPKSKKTCENKGGVWTAANHSTWNGCVTDRGDASGPSSGNYDTNVVSPTTTTKATLFPAEQYGSCPQSVMGLNNDWVAMNTLVDGMVASGTTNQGIGLAWGWLSLAGGGPFTVPAMDTNFKYVQAIILLSDGMNTENRWHNSQTPIDARQKITCDNAKAAGITIYTIQVNTSGDPVSSVLQACASDSTKFYLLKSAGEMITVFNNIGKELTKLRIAQ
jgi:Flp pilus assembly protein TadG